MELNGKTALVTGGTDGIGAELIRQLRVYGVTCIAVGRNPERVAVTRAAGFETVECDLTTPEGIEAVVAAVGERKLDLLVNNAATEAAHDFRNAEPDLAEVDFAVALNFTAPIHLITRLMPHLRSAGQATVVNVTSGLAIAPRAAGSVYCATKAALRSYTQALRFQFKGTGIQFLEVLPPVVDTKMVAEWTKPKMPPKECVRQIVEAIIDGDDEVCVGEVKLLKLAHSLSPAWARRTMLRF